MPHMSVAQAEHINLSQMVRIAMRRSASLRWQRCLQKSMMHVGVGSRLCLLRQPPDSVRPSRVPEPQAGTWHCPTGPSTYSTPSVLAAPGIVSDKLVTGHPRMPVHWFQTLG